MTTSDAAPVSEDVPAGTGAGTFEAMLRAASLRVTRPRVAVLTAVQERPHSDTDTILRSVRADLGEVSHQAVYDVLRALTTAGLVRRIEPAGSAALYETRTGDNHHHLVCRTCGAVADLCQSYCDSRPGIFGLHCGAVRTGTHLVAFTGPYRAGKTTLVTRLGADPDVTLFCDDVLPVLPDAGWKPGGDGGGVFGGAAGASTAGKRRPTEALGG